jgi:hypothetical protein
MKKKEKEKKPTTTTQVTKMSNPDLTRKNWEWIQVLVKVINAWGRRTYILVIITLLRNCKYLLWTFLINDVSVKTLTTNGLFDMALQVVVFFSFFFSFCFHLSSSCRFI